MNKCVTIISFSPRAAGNCGNIASYISNYHGANTRIFHVDRGSVAACGGCDYECLTPGKRCPQLSQDFAEMLDALCDSDLVYFIVPNICGYPCANYFAFNERCVGYFGMDRDKKKAYMQIPKKFIVVSNTEGFEAAMQYQTNEVPKILYMKTGKYRKRSTAGDILDSEEAVADLQRFLDEE